jgi:hypothetical protein
MVDWITDQIAIGNRIEGRDRTLLETHGFDRFSPLTAFPSQSFPDS